MPRGRKVLVVGSGGREHALAVALLGSPSVAEVLVSPGNAGTARSGLRNASGAPLEVARREKPDLVVIGPEAPLTEGLSDVLMAEGFTCFGPSKNAARLEGSKAFMKEIATRFSIRTARHVTVTDPVELERAIRSFPIAPVVKADGLCAGKGVVVAQTHAEALAAAGEMLSGARFGEAGRRVVIEERLEGVEASVHAICDGERVLLLPAAQDHKRIGDGDTGPNTGGMGTYAPTPVVTEALAKRIQAEIIEPAVRGLAELGTPFRGTLFAGLMVNNDEPVLLEFNVRFGDPETQVLVSTTEGDFAELFASAATGKLTADAVRPNREHAVCVVLAARGYPGIPKTGDSIRGIDEAEEVPGVRVYHAGTRAEDGRLLTAGGRVLGVTARGATLAIAHERAYRAADRVQFDGKQLRRDIAARAL